MSDNPDPAEKAAPELSRLGMDQQGKLVVTQMDQGIFLFYQRTDPLGQQG